MANRVVGEITFHVRLTQPDHSLRIPDFHKGLFFEVTHWRLLPHVTARVGESVVSDIHRTPPEQMAWVAALTLEFDIGDFRPVYLNFVSLESDFINAWYRPQFPVCIDFVDILLQ